MPYPVRKYQQYQSDYNRLVMPVRTQPARKVLRPVPKRKKVVKKRNVFAQFISFCFLLAVGIFILPLGFNRISKQLIFGPPNSEIKLDYHKLLFPTTNYLSNDLFMNKRFLSGAKTKKPEMTTLYMTDKMPVIEKRLKDLMKSYPSIDPTIFAWEYDGGKYVDINADKLYSAASIIKIPVLIQMFKSIEKNQFTIYDEMILTDYYKASGSGNLQSRTTGTKLTMDELARTMIEDSDNSSTNMIISAVGSMTDVNQALRNWGLKKTYVENWLPDLEGSNYTTSKDLATMLYNLDNPGFLNINSREYIIDYMSHVKNNRLIQAGLAPNALFVHKTGDIGKMLGDAGIVYMPNGKKYIVVILANRPYNSPQGKDFIQKASAIIYNSIASGVY